MEPGSWHLDGNADAVEFCPHESYHHVLSASTYNLREGDPPTRTGSISLFQIDPQKGQFELFHKVETSGIFDIKWNPVGSNVDPLLGQADADGYLRIRSLHCYSDEPTGYSLKEVSGKKISSAMCLWLDWNPSATAISVGLSNGSVSVVSISESQLDVVQEWQAHDFEVWAASFDIHQPHLVYTGSADCKFSCWDIREQPSNTVFQNSKVHKMGVCCISKSPCNPNTLLTGSYDEYLRLWDVRSILKPVNQVSACLCGGVWRLKHHPFIPDVILAACMHNGFAIVKIKEEGVAERWISRRRRWKESCSSNLFLLRQASSCMDSSKHHAGVPHRFSNTLDAKLVCSIMFYHGFNTSTRIKPAQLRGSCGEPRIEGLIGGLYNGWT